MKTVIIPAIDLIDGKCVRLSQGDYNRCKIYNSDPLEAAKQFEGCGVRMLHLVDLDGAKSNAPQNLNILEKIASNTSLNIEFGGGIKSQNNIISALDAGALRVICGSTACTNPQQFIEWLKQYGADRIVFGADLKNNKPATNGWLEEVDVSLESLMDLFISHGLKHSIITDISKDGMMQGPSYYLYSTILERYPSLNIIASGGVCCLDDIIKLQSIGIKEVIVGKAIYEGKITLNDLSKYNL